jgi:hypothetical protein
MISAVEGTRFLSIDRRACTHWRHWLPSRSERNSAKHPPDPLLQQSAQMVPPHTRHQWRWVTKEKVTSHSGHVACVLSTGIESPFPLERGFFVLRDNFQLSLVDDVVDESRANPDLR